MLSTRCLLFSLTTRAIFKMSVAISAEQIAFVQFFNHLGEILFHIFDGLDL